jgi:hypothetical protein
MKTNIHFLSISFISSWNKRCLGQKGVQYIEIHILCSATFLENYAVYENVEKYCRDWQATGDNMARAHYMLGNLSLQIHAQNKQYFLLFHYTIDCTNASQFVRYTYYIAYWKRADTSSTHPLCLSQHSHPTNVLWKVATVYDQACQ